MKHQHFLPMQNVIQDYAWGSVTSINTLFGIANPDNKPQAEIWMGAHPGGCSEVVTADKTLRLEQFVTDNLSDVLSEAISQKFGELPYLFKVLAAASALSIQVHPSKAQAEQGFAKEEAAGIARNAANRNYKDPNHKPELVYALTRYQAMNGFRSYEEILNNFEQLNIEELAPLINAYKTSLDATGLEALFVSMLKLDGQAKDTALNKLLAFAETKQGDETFELILWLKDLYPGDIGLFSPLFLHVLTLEPGEAMFLHACTPHAYCRGTGLEIMASSDNVLRAGLTPKHIDVEELASCTIFEPKLREELLTQPEMDNGAEHYPIPVEDFKFSVYVDQQDRFVNVTTPEILFALDEPIVLTHLDGETITVERGHSVFIPASAGNYSVTCAGKFARAYC